MEKIEINDIHEFIEQIESLDRNYYYRGESSLNFSEIVASAFREYSIPFSKSKKRIDYRKALKEYYIEVGHQLTELERDNFMQYAQHHGLITPLIDITSNPLIALYFACSSNYDENTCKVHAFNKERFIDLSDFEIKSDMNLNSFFLDNQFTYQIFVNLSKLPYLEKYKLLVKCVESLRPIMTKDSPLYLEKNVGIELDATFAQVLREFTENEYESPEIYMETLEKIFYKYFEVDFRYSKERDSFGTKIALKGKSPIFEVYYRKYLSDTLAVVILLAIQQQKNSMLDDFTKGAIGSYEVKSYVNLPLISIQPSVKFERMRAQEGTFLYQVPLYLGHPDTAEDFIGFSKVDSDIELVIKNKEKIFNSLGKLGVNQKTIFPDHDNIAEYLKIVQLMD